MAVTNVPRMAGYLMESCHYLDLSEPESAGLEDDFVPFSAITCYPLEGLGGDIQQARTRRNLVHRPRLS